MFLQFDFFLIFDYKLFNALCLCLSKVKPPTNLGFKLAHFEINAGLYVHLGFGV
jgi:hypothetical protein